MIVLVTGRERETTLRSIVDGTFGVPTPRLRLVSYRRLGRARTVPRATYVFADFERLTPADLRKASRLYRRLTAAGLACLSDPAAALTRVELLVALQKAGINPFRAWRADADPRPERFPVAIRQEEGHRTPDAALYHDQDALDAALVRLRHAGTPLRGLLITEIVAEPYRPGLWAKWGTWRIGQRLVPEHIAVDDTWLVKIGDHAKVTEAVAADEHAAISGPADPTVARAFALSGIEFGRADHGVFAGRPVVYEINTNPFIGYYKPSRIPLRVQSQLIARRNLADALDCVDSAAGGFVRLPDAPDKTRAWWRPRVDLLRRL